MKNLVLTVCTLLLSFSLIQAQEDKEQTSKQDNLIIKVKDDAKPDIYVDGKKFDFSMDLLDPDKIESVTVLKGVEAMNKYGAKHGVVIITTRNKDPEKMPKIKVRGYDNTSGDAPMIIIDGEKSNQQALKKLSPDDIFSIKILKDAASTAKYGTESKNGVIIITTKKAKKK